MAGPARERRIGRGNQARQDGGGGGPGRGEVMRKSKSQTDTDSLMNLHEVKPKLLTPRLRDTAFLVPKAPLTAASHRFLPGDLQHKLSLVLLILISSILSSFIRTQC